MPFDVKKTITIQIKDTAGGRGIIVQNPVNAEGMDFLPLTYKNRRVAALLHGNKEKGWPRSVIHALKSARNTRIDALIADHLKSDDPLAESVCVIDKKERAQQFHTSQIPLAIDVLMPAFVDHAGQIVHATSLKMLATPQSSALLSMHMTSESIEWLKSKCKGAPESDSEASDESDDNAIIEQLNLTLPSHFSLNVSTMRLSNGNRKRKYTLKYDKKVGKTRVRRERHFDFDPDADVESIKRQLTKVVHKVERKISGAAVSSSESAD